MEITKKLYYYDSQGIKKSYTIDKAIADKMQSLRISDRLLISFIKKGKLNKFLSLPEPVDVDFRELTNFKKAIDIRKIFFSQFRKYYHRAFRNFLSKKNLWQDLQQEGTLFSFFYAAYSVEDKNDFLVICAFAHSWLKRFFAANGIKFTREGRNNCEIIISSDELLDIAYAMSSIDFVYPEI